MPRMREHSHQAALIHLCNLFQRDYPELGLIYAIPNGGARNAVTGAMLKAEGVRRGVPDIHLPVARGKFYSLYIEMKAGNNKPSPDQEEFIARLCEQGNLVHVCYSAEEAWVRIVEYLDP